MSYSKSHKKKNDGLYYDRLYKKGTFDYDIWKIEQQVLNKLLIKLEKNINILDFACGTGRITKFLEDLGFSNIYGFDVSDEMLEIAKKKLLISRLFNLDINKNNFNKYENTFHLVTAFRFFLNAEESLRESAFKNINKQMKKGGYFIFNIHGNKNSLRFFYVLFFNLKQKIKYFLFRKNEHIFTYKKQLSVSDIKKYLKRHNFTLIDTISISFLGPFFHFILPKNLFFFLENKLISTKFLFGTHLIFITKKN